MWKCKHCGNEVEMYTMTVIEKSYKLKKDTNFVILKNNSVDERTRIFYRCTKCDSTNNNLKEIAYWEK